MKGTYCNKNQCNSYQNVYLILHYKNLVFYNTSYYEIRQEIAMSESQLFGIIVLNFRFINL